MSDTHLDTEQRKWALEKIEDRTTPEPDGEQDVSSNVWTSLQRLKGDASKTEIIERHAVKPLVTKLSVEELVLYWHRLIAPANPEHLRAVIKSESMSKAPRKILIEKCNDLLQSETELVTDGGSKYINPTAPGYQGVYRVSKDVQISLGTLPVDWEVDQTVYVIEDGPGVSVVAKEPASPLKTVSIKPGNTSSGGRQWGTILRFRIQEFIDVDEGDDIRAYKRTAGGLRLVPANPDPLLVTDGGESDGS